MSGEPAQATAPITDSPGSSHQPTAPAYGPEPLTPASRAPAQVTSVAEA